MPRHRAGAAALLVSALVLTACGDTPSDPDATTDRVEALQEELDRARSRISDLEAAATDPGDGAGGAQADSGGENGTDPDEAHPGDGPVEGADVLANVADPRTPEGLTDQVRVHMRAARDLGLPEEWEPNATAWVPYEVPDEVDGTYETPGDVVAALARAADARLLGRDQWETTIRVLLDEGDPDLAYGAVLSWGYLDDAVSGRDVRITLTRTEEDQWEPGRAEQRFHCRRALADDETRCV